MELRSTRRKDSERCQGFTKNRGDEGWTKARRPRGNGNRTLLPLGSAKPNCGGSQRMKPKPKNGRYCKGMGTLTANVS